MEPALLEKFQKAVKRYEMLESGDRVLVGFSGGPDSVFLVEILMDMKDFYGIELACIHINHMLRGQESFRDEDFCADFCRRKNLPIYIERVDVSRLKGEDESIEVAARRLRYENFTLYAKNYGFNKIALAHTASDSVETFLINLMRGSGIWGLRGIPPKRDIFIRPLIFITREEILHYLEKRKIPYVIDSSNLETLYLRNTVRLNLLPFLERIRQGAFQKILETTEIMGNLGEFLEEFLISMRESVLKPSFENTLLIDYSKFRNYHYSLQEVFLQRELMLTFQEIENLESLLERRKPGWAGKYFVYPSSREVFIAQGKRSLSQRVLSLEDFPISFEDYNIKVRLTSLPEDERFSTRVSKALFPLEVRSRKPGDRLGDKLLSDYFERKKIPGWRRDLYPVFEKDGEILWVPGIGSKLKEGNIFMEVRKIDDEKFWIFD